MQNCLCVETRIDRSDQPVSADCSPHLGWFRFYFDDDRWEWSAQVEQMHGYTPGAVAPTTLLLLSHVHPDDERHVTATLHDMRRTPQPFSSCHRIIDTRRRVHDVAVVGAPFYDMHGAPIGMQGFYLDVTPLAPTLSDSPAYQEVARNLRIAADGNAHTEDRRQRVRAATQC